MTLNPETTRVTTGLLRSGDHTSTLARSMTEDGTQTDSRYHALDSMRATLMLLGIYLHVVVGYSGVGNWPYVEKNPTHALDLTLGVIHSFRMPGFFAMAGFFGALLWDRRGAGAFIGNRARRILLPFSLFWPLLFPLVLAMGVVIDSGVRNVRPYFASGAFWGKLHPLHLWFLEYLLMLYMVGGAATWLATRFPAAIRQRIRAAYRWGLTQAFAPLLFALLSWPWLIAMQGDLKDCDGFIPEPLILGAYLVPFGFGWLLYNSMDLFPRFQSHIGIYLALAVPAVLVYWLLRGPNDFVIAAAGNAVLCWLLIFACLGLFLRYCSAENPAWRYLSDASYWMFIMHVPVVIGLQVVMKAVPLPALADVPVVLAISVLILAGSYDLFVRPTWIGALLNGRRHSRGLPRIEGRAYAAIPAP